MDPFKGACTDFFLKTCLRVCYLSLQLFHKLNRAGERLPLVASQRLQVQDGLCALGLQDSDGLQQPLVAETEQRCHVKTAVDGRDALHYLTWHSKIVQRIKLSDHA